MNRNPNVLAVDDDVNICLLIKAALGDKYNLFSATSVNDALQILQTENIDIVLLDIVLNGENGLSAIQPMKDISKFTEIIMLTGSSRIQDVVQAMKLGASDYLHKPFAIEELMLAMEKTVNKISADDKISLLEEDIGRFKKFADLVYVTPVMQKIVDTIKQVAPLDSTVLIQGESGTGKELVAQAIHNNSKRKDGPFIAINCASIPDTLFESEMFGFEKGSFTGAIQTKKGKFEIANGGTIFFDELPSLRAAGQASLLRAIENKEIERVGSTRKINLDIRIISASNRSLHDLVREDKFRADLYYRLNVIPLEIPPLRERKDDIESLVSYFIKKYNYILGKKIENLDSDALEALKKYDWPGNVRELENLIERLIALTNGDSDPIIAIDRIPLEIIMPENSLINSNETLNLESGRKQFERELIIAALEKVNWNRTLTSKMLGVHVNTLLKKMSELRITPPNHH